MFVYMVPGQVGGPVSGEGRRVRPAGGGRWVRSVCGMDNFIVSRRSFSSAGRRSPVPMHCFLYILPPPFPPPGFPTHHYAFSRHPSPCHRRRHGRQAPQPRSPGILPGPRRCPSPRLATQTVRAWLGYLGPHKRRCRHWRRCRLLWRCLRLDSRGHGGWYTGIKRVVCALWKLTTYHYQRVHSILITISNAAT